jgi:excisionase family DNA binding protein
MKTKRAGYTQYRPGALDIRLARESALLLKPLRSPGKNPLIVRVNGQDFSLPSALRNVLGDCLQLVAAGQSFTVLPVEQEIGTQEAADLLGVSRPHLVKLLDAGTIASRKVGVQRRVRAGDVLGYRENEKTARRKALADLAAEGQLLGLGE